MQCLGIFAFSNVSRTISLNCTNLSEFEINKFFFLSFLPPSKLAILERKTRKCSLSFRRIRSKNSRESLKTRTKTKAINSSFIPIKHFDIISWQINCFSLCIGSFSLLIFCLGLTPTLLINNRQNIFNNI